MKNTKKLLALLLAILMVVGIFVGCGAKEEAEEESRTETAEKEDTKKEEAKEDDAAEEKIQLTIAYEADVLPADPETWYACQQMEEDLGVEITWLDWGEQEDTYREKVDLAMASGEVPDMFMIHSDAAGDKVQNYINQEMLLCIEDYWADYPNVRKWNDTDTVRDTITYADDGKIYTTVRQYSAPVYYFGLLARQDLIEKIGFEYDGTLESLTNLMRALKEETGSYVMTDRNGPQSMVGQIGGFFGTQIDMLGWDAEKGEFNFIGSDERLYNALVWLNQLYEEGLLDPEYALNTEEMWIEKLSTGTATLTMDYLARAEMTTNPIREQDPSSEYVLAPIALPLTPDGYKPKTWVANTLFTQYQTAISVDTAYPEKCMEILDYIHSDKALDWLNYGQEGMTFEYGADGKAALKDNVPNALNNFTVEGEPVVAAEYLSSRIPFFKTILDTDAFALTYYGQYSYKGYVMYSENEWIDELAPAVPLSYFSEGEKDELADIATLVGDYYTAEIQDFIEGIRPLTEEEYAKFQDECLNEYGAARWVEIMTNAYNAWKG